MASCLKVLTGDVRDQAQLYGLIGRLQEFGIELLAVEPADSSDGGSESGLLPGPGGRPVAVQHLGLVLVPRGRRPVRVDDQGPAPPGGSRPGGGSGHSSTQSLTDVVPPLALCLVWCTWHAQAGWWQPQGPLAVPVPQQHRVADPRRHGLGVPDVQRQAGRRRAPSSRRRRTARPPGPDSRSTALPITACSRAARAASRTPSRRCASSSTHSRTRSSRASTLTSPVTMGAIAASPAIAAAASPSSHAPSDAPVSAACARRAASRARTCPVHWSCRAESPSSSIRSAREMCAQALTGCPARSGSRFAACTGAHRLGQRIMVPLALGPVVLGPGGGASASSTAATAAAHSAVRSPCITPAPPIVVASFTSRSANSRPGS